MGRLDKKCAWSKCKESGVTRYKMSRIVEVGQVKWYSRRGSDCALFHRETRRERELYVIKK